MGALSDCCLSVCLSVVYIGPKSRTERPRKTKIGTEVAHVTHDSDTTLKVKGHRGWGHIVVASYTACLCYYGIMYVVQYDNSNKRKALKKKIVKQWLSSLQYS